MTCLATRDNHQVDELGRENVSLAVGFTFGMVVLLRHAQGDIEETDWRELVSYFSVLFSLKSRTKLAGD
jgi:hypothetical protein